MVSDFLEWLGGALESAKDFAKNHLRCTFSENYFQIRQN